MFFDPTRPEKGCNFSKPDFAFSTNANVNSSSSARWSKESSTGDGDEEEEEDVAKLHIDSTVQCGLGLSFVQSEPTRPFSGSLTLPCL